MAGSKEVATAPEAAAAAASAAASPEPETVVLVTGCSAGGIGYALARELASRPGVFVIATARNVDAMRGLHEEHEGEGEEEPLPPPAPSSSSSPPSAKSKNKQHNRRGRVALLPLDVADASSVAACRARVDALTRGRGVDVLVNNAGATVQGALLDVSLDAARRVFEVNVLGGLAAAQTFCPDMVARGGGGLVVNVGSAAGYASLPLKAVYSASKHSVRVLSDALRVELAPFGVRVLLVAPGYVRTAIDTRSRASGGWFAPAYGASAYALYAKAAGIVGSSIFDEGGLGGGRSLPVGVFARLLADAMARELRGARRCAAAGTREVRAGAGGPGSSSSVVRVGEAARAGGRGLARPFGGGKQGEGGGDGEEQRAPLELAGRPTTASARARLAGPPAGLDLLLAPRAWLPGCLGGPTRHLRLGPCATSAWLSGSLLPLWASDLVFGKKMGLCGRDGGKGGKGARGAPPASASAQVTASAASGAGAGKKGLGKKQQ